MVNSGKRNTRSRTTITDHFSRVQLDLSPLKQARSAMRNADVIAATDSSDVGSSGDAASCKKRLASPSAIDKEEKVERELKRSKISSDEDEVSRGLPTSGWNLEPFPFPNNSLTLPPPSVSGSTTPTRNVGLSPRARSVPPSIPSTPGRVPYLDLSKYRSPVKSAHRVRVMSVPPSSPPVRSVEKGVEMGEAMDRDLDKTPVPRMVVERVERVRRIVDQPPPAFVVASNLDSRNEDPFSHEFGELPETPVQKTPPPLGSMSPLTPLSSFRSSSQAFSSTSHPPDDHALADPMNVDPPVPPPQSQSQSELLLEPKRESRPDLTRQSSHLIPPQPTPLSFRLPSRSPTPPSQRVSRSRSGSVEPPIPALPYPLLPSTSNTSSGPPPDAELVFPATPTISDPQPLEKQSSHELPHLTKPPDPEVTTPAAAPTPATDATESDKKGKGKAKEQAPGPSKLPTTKSTKTSRLRSTMVNAGPSGVTRTRAAKGIGRPTPISREGRVTRSSTAKSRQVDALQEKEAGLVNAATKPKGDSGESGIGDQEKEGKGDKIPGIISFACPCSYFISRELISELRLFRLFNNAGYAKATEIDGFCPAHRQLAGEVEAFLPN